MGGLWIVVRFGGYRQLLPLRFAFYQPLGDLPQAFGQESQHRANRLFVSARRID
jgi:hypothetical protein